MCRENGPIDSNHFYMQLHTDMSRQDLMAVVHTHLLTKERQLNLGHQAPSIIMNTLFGLSTLPPSPNLFTRDFFKAATQRGNTRLSSLQINTLQEICVSMGYITLAETTIPQANTWREPIDIPLQWYAICNTTLHQMLKDLRKKFAVQDRQKNTDRLLQQAELWFATYLGIRIFPFIENPDLSIDAIKPWHDTDPALPDYSNSLG